MVRLDSLMNSYLHTLRPYYLTASLPTLLTYTYPYLSPNKILSSTSIYLGYTGVHSYASQHSYSHSLLHICMFMPDVLQHIFYTCYFVLYIHCATKIEGSLPHSQSPLPAHILSQISPVRAPTPFLEVPIYYHPPIYV